MNRAALYRTIWRWHFYAGLFVIPFIIVLSLSGALYLFKPQVERWEERAFQGHAAAAPIAPHRQVGAALTAYGGGTVLDYRLPERAGDAAMVRLAWPSGNLREVFVAPDGTVLGHLDPSTRIMAFAKRVHSELLVGKLGNWLVELAASWAIVMVLSGLYLWWPRDRRVAGVLWPRWGRGRRMFWRDLHAVTGFWISGLALVLLVSGLPWAGVWGNALTELRGQMGWTRGAAQWDIGGAAPAPNLAPASEHDHHAHHHHDMSGLERPPVGAFDPRVLDRMVALARAEGLAFPAIITPPGGPGRYGAPAEMAWTIRSDAQNRPLRMTISYDLAGERELSRETFADTHPIDRAVGYGIAWHEGQLFGWINQLVGVLTALGLVVLAVSGFVMWRRRRPEGAIGAPPPATAPPRMAGVVAILLVLALLLPLLALSLIGLWLFDRLLLPRLPAVANWLGVPIHVSPPVHSRMENP